MAFTKTTCPVTKTQFLSHATPLTVVIDGKEYTADVKEFSTGSLGWYLTAKVPVLVDGVKCQVQVGMNLTLVGSKEMAQQAVAPAPMPTQALATAAA